MPQWVDNTLLVRGPESEIIRFKTAVHVTGGRRASRRTDLSLQALVPRPRYAGLDRAAAYQWGVLTWGTPWDVRARLAADGGTILDYAFPSAYGPPLAWLKTASARFPALEFLLRYHNPSAHVRGSAMVTGGEEDDVRSHFGSFLALQYLKSTEVVKL